MAENEVSCEICFEDFDRGEHEPRKLPCCHTFCSECLEKVISETSIITCPHDRSAHSLGELGVFGLPVDSSKLSEIDKREARSPNDDDINFSSDFVDPSRPPTAHPQRGAQRVNPVRNQPQMSYNGYNSRQPNNVAYPNYYNNPQLPVYNHQAQANSQPSVYNPQAQAISQLPVYNHQAQAISQLHVYNNHNALNTNEQNTWHSPSHWSYHLNNYPIHQYYQPPLTRNIQTTAITHCSGPGQNVFVHINHGYNSSVVDIVNHY